MHILDILFPKTCLSCGSWGQYICKRCQRQFVPIQKDACVYCDRISQYGQVHERCLRIQDIDGYIGLWYLTPPLQRVIKKIKYKLVTDAFRAVCATVHPNRIATLQQFAADRPGCVIQPIPLHPARRAKRGFNQADLISQFLYEVTRFPVMSSLKRVRNTSPQAETTSRMARYINMKNAFCVTDMQSVYQKDIVLVDDIYTTGNTVKEAARVCKQAGAARVYVFTLAKG